MRKIVAVTLLLFAIAGFVSASESWQPKSWSLGNGTVKTTLAGWVLKHFPDTDAELLMVENAKYPVAAITDYPDSVEVRAFNGSSGEFITIRDKDHDRLYEEIEGLKDGTILKLDGGSYKLVKADDKWSLSEMQ